jgi:DNA-binding HxlR family transcriptional regulator
MIAWRGQEGTRTAAAHLEVSKMGEQTCILDQTSGPRRLLDVIGDKWAVLVIYALQTGTMRFNAIERALPGISQKMLAQTLKRLEAAGLVARQAYAEVPPRVEYRLRIWDRASARLLRRCAGGRTSMATP